MNYYECMLIWNIVLAIATSVMAIAIGVMAGFAIVQWLHFKKARYSTLLMQLDQMWNSLEYSKARNMVNQYAYGSTPEEASKNLKEAMISFDEANAEEYLTMVKIANFFENLGFLACKHYLTREDALELFGGATRNYWNMFSALAKYDKSERDDKRPDVWIYFEKLALEVSKKKDALD